MRLRQQDPATKLWSMCQITTFASAAGARVSVIIDWYYTGVTFAAPIRLLKTKQAHALILGVRLDFLRAVAALAS